MRPIFDRLPSALRYSAGADGLFIDAAEHKIEFLPDGSVSVGEGLISFPSGEVLTSEVIIGNQFVGDWNPSTEYHVGEVVKATAYDGLPTYITYQQNVLSTDLAEDLDNGDAIEIAIPNESGKYYLYFKQESLPIDYIYKKPWTTSNLVFTQTSGGRLFPINGEIETMEISYINGSGVMSIIDPETLTVLASQSIVNSSGTISFTLNTDLKYYILDGSFLVTSINFIGGYEYEYGSTGLTTSAVNIFLSIELPEQVANLGILTISGGIAKSFTSEKLISTDLNYSVADWLTRYQDESLVSTFELLSYEKFFNSQSYPWLHQQIGNQNLVVFDFTAEQLETLFINSHTKQELLDWPYSNTFVGRHLTVLDIQKNGPADYIINGRPSATIELWSRNTYYLLNDAEDIVVTGSDIIRDGRYLSIGGSIQDASTSADVIITEWENTTDWADHYEDYKGLYPSKGTDESIHFMFDLLRLHGYDLDSLTLLSGDSQTILTEVPQPLIAEDNDDLLSEDNSPLIAEQPFIDTDIIFSSNAVVKFTPSNLDLPVNLRVTNYPFFRAGQTLLNSKIGSGRSFVKVGPTYIRNTTKWNLIREVLNRFASNTRICHSVFAAGFSIAGDPIFDPS